MSPLDKVYIAKHLRSDCKFLLDIADSHLHPNHNTFQRDNELKKKTPLFASDWKSVSSLALTKWMVICRARLRGNFTLK